MSQKIEKLVTQIQELQNKIKVEGEVLFKDVFADFFAKHPLAKAVKWSQYTPYFNDGSPCTFSRNDAELRLDLEKYVGASLEFLEGEDACHAYSLEQFEGRTSWNTYPEGLRTELTSEEQSLLADYSSLVKSLWRDELEDLFQALFGDHVEVTVTAAGVTTEECDHD